MDKNPGSVLNIHEFQKAYFKKKKIAYCFNQNLSSFFLPFKLSFFFIYDFPFKCERPKVYRHRRCQNFYEKWFGLQGNFSSILLMLLFCYNHFLNVFFPLHCLLSARGYSCSYFLCTDVKQQTNYDLICQVQERLE